jgi:hypothetical protein
MWDSFQSAEDLDCCRSDRLFCPRSWTATIRRPVPLGGKLGGKIAKWSASGVVAASGRRPGARSNPSPPPTRPRCAHEVGHPPRRARGPGRVRLADPPVHRPWPGIRLRCRPDGRPGPRHAVRHARSRTRHQPDRCSFETALACYDLADDPALEEIAHIAHEADLADDRYDAPAATGLDVLIRGVALTSGSDHETLTCHPTRYSTACTSTPAAS